MIELRWLERKTGKTLMNDWGYYYDETDRVLQYRQKVDTNIYAGFNRPEKFMPNMQWSEWKDVPIVKEES
jgi:hypothetical protein